MFEDVKIWDIISNHFFTNLCNFPYFLKLTHIISTVRKKGKTLKTSPVIALKSVNKIKMILNNFIRLIDQKLFQKSIIIDISL